MDLLTMSISAAVMIAAIVILRALLIDRLPKTTFLILWAVVLLRLLVPVSVPSAWSDFYPRPHMEGDSRRRNMSPWTKNFYPRPHMEGDSKHAEVQACISAAYLKCSTRKAAASRRCADLGGKAVLFHQFPHLVLGRARCEPRGEGMCDRGSHRQSGRKWFKLTAIKCHPGSTEGPDRCVPPCFYSGCPADKSAGCPSGDRSAQ